MRLEPHRKIPNTQIRVYSYRLLQRGFMNNSYTLIACFSRTLLKQEYYQPSPAPPPPPKQISIADTDKEQLQKLNDDIPLFFLHV